MMSSASLIRLSSLTWESMMDRISSRLLLSRCLIRWTLTASSLKTTSTRSMRSLKPVSNNSGITTMTYFGGVLLRLQFCIWSFTCCRILGCRTASNCCLYFLLLKTIAASFFLFIELSSLRMSSPNREIISFTMDLSLLTRS